MSTFAKKMFSMRKFFYLPSALLSLLLIVTGCFDWEHTPQPYLVITGTYVLNGGSDEADASLVKYFYRGTEAPTDLFAQANNGKTLGARAEDMLCVNGCFYICATADKVLYKTDSLGRILTEIVTPETARSPRHITIYKNHLYVSYAEGFVAEIDTTTSAIRVLEVGGTPNGIAAANDKVYVALSGNESTEVTVIEARTFAVMSSLAVDPNPGKLITHSEKLIYLLSDGNGADVKSSLQIIEAKEDEVYQLKSIHNALDFTLVPGGLVYALTEAEPGTFHICPIDGALGMAIQENILGTDEKITLPTSLSTDPVNGAIFLGQKDAEGHNSVKIFSRSGMYLDTFKTGGTAPAGVYFSTAVQYI